MRHALGLARRGLGNVWPNPTVGCVIVAGGRVVGRGWTQPGGRPHGEVRALMQAGDLARGATAYVTLEPCAHYGKTPPCANALVAAGVARVVSAATDPDPRVAGKGHAILRDAGIEVTEGVLGDAARELNAGFLKRMTRGLPLVTLKLAATLDGRIATASGESRWITGPEARRAVHAMRLTHDAVMVGAGTALADDPDLTVREMGAPRQPLRVLLDSNLRHSPQSRLGRTAAQHPVWIFHAGAAPAAARNAWREAGARLFELGETRVPLRDALHGLAAEGVTRVLSEGGATMAAALLREELVDELAVFSAGKIIGGDGVPAIAPMALAHLAEAPRFRLQQVQTMGGDILSRWRYQ
ncbi:bifunctional diaminohydroxyphosphoribosylaminopyrimidine deaminase/5-amino-6-(5-phosphoribosylamino)uracil reductase RibD [Cereibacter sp. SYSU M97828]|nr:bifunctional diaminohydroxyphosphoribosylaminopyrimidine deaminase/5-amino-6-(5-phosphoribosylamino)uracil reductase RibD [Cereibacter flavus]